MRRLLMLGWAVAALTLPIVTSPASAQSCGKSYTVVVGDNLSEIAGRAYDDGRKWSAIYYANKDVIGKDATLISPGQVFKIPCLDTETAKAASRSTSKIAKAAAEPKPVSPAAASDPVPASVATTSGTITLLTAGDYRPFTDRSLPKGGMITDIVSSALEHSKAEAGGPAFKVNWVNDWSAHLDPLLVNRAFDMGFPWFQPDCDRYEDLDEPAKFRCDRFYFSEPVFEILVLFFTSKNSDFRFTSDDDVTGKRLCRPSGYFTFDLDKDGRNWIKDDKVVLLRPQSVEECFRLLENGEVDAVTLNEFTGREAVKKLGMNGKVDVIERPVSLLGLHVIVAKDHPNAKAYLEQVDAALERIKSDGTYGKIVDKHLGVFWASQESS